MTKMCLERGHADAMMQLVSEDHSLPQQMHSIAGATTIIFVRVQI
jgi:hypothetical protein